MRITRNQLFSLLSEACEIEHSLACAYLYAAFSLKNGPGNGLDWRAQQVVRRWAGQIYFVASQEMLHLAQAWNILTAIGGTPYFMRPAFPQPKGYWPLPAALTLTPFSIRTLERFMQWEAPIETTLRTGFQRWPHEPTDPDLRFRSVGQLYDLVADGIEAAPEAELFISDPALQIGPDLADFPDLLRVVDKASAIDAVRRIQHQGEGIRADREDSHFGIFFEMLEELRQALQDTPSFDPAYPSVDNPSTRARSGAHLVTAESTRAAMGLFSDIYVLSMRLLGWVFGPGVSFHPQTTRFAKAGIAVMPTILKPLGEQLARMPFGDTRHTAGAAFELQRHVPLASDPAVALRLVLERINELALAAEDFQRVHAADQSLAWLPKRLLELGQSIRSG